MDIESVWKRVSEFLGYPFREGNVDAEPKEESKVEVHGDPDGKNESIGG